MKKLELSRILGKYTFRGILFGLIVVIGVILMNRNSEVFLQSNRSIADMFYLFPGMWLLLLLPFATGAIGYALALSFTKIIRKQRKSIKAEAKRSDMVLKFINNLRQGNLDTVNIGSGKKDQLSKSLLKLRDYLIKSKKEQEQGRLEEEQRTWITQGLAQFAEILRRNNDNLEVLSYNIISYMVNYLKINQGGVFLANTNNRNEKIFELTACIAFDRKKYADKYVPWEDGLIGRCALEKETIYITDLPDDYINITSGLGEANPKALLIVPLKVNDEIYGVIELASFSEFEPFEIEFVEKTAESIASTISTVQINIQTTKLLHETQIQAEKMSQQEEELRQNLEEMQATQEESDRREVEMKGILEAIDNSAISCEFETDGSLISVNQLFLQTFKYLPEEVEGQNLRIFFFQDEVEELTNILSDLKSGRNFKGRVRRRTKLGEEIFLLTTYTPVIDNNGDIVKILSLENDVTDQVRMEEQMKSSKEELGVLLEQARDEMKEQFKEIESVKIRNEKMLEGALDAIITTNKEGIMEFFNEAAEKLWGYERSEVLGQHISMLFAPETAKNDAFVHAYVTTEENKVIGERKEVPIKNKFGDEIPVLFLLSEAQVGDDHSFTAFIQNVEVELF
ncbi:PAS domain S-box protein [Saccharicrinis fermentans]|uniref:Sensor protein FixL n=1 Tax=Saccharicrinis fermentans DSM 9555 = JCM 21142 TaxID=869213 RepID=W7YBM2_9BACT|nr:PAS domain S-box protein [Saccharicrinis fermentans]GAF01836.1 sensor protein FixL [Saccharicrinis fermentans DSM 9555 = JCM 21142]